MKRVCIHVQRKVVSDYSILRVCTKKWAANIYMSVFVKFVFCLATHPYGGRRGGIIYRLAGKWILTPPTTHQTLEKRKFDSVSRSYVKTDKNLPSAFLCGPSSRLHYFRTALLGQGELLPALSNTMDFHVWFINSNKTKWPSDNFFQKLLGGRLAGKWPWRQLNVHPTAPNWTF